MGNRGTTSGEFPDWYITFQTDVLSQLPRPGEISKETTLEWHGNRGAMKGALHKTLATPTTTDKLLKLVGTATIPATKKFVASNRFKLDASVDAEIRIGYVNDNFRIWFSGKTEGPNSVAKLRYWQLLENSLDKPILNELGTTAETTLFMIWRLLKLYSWGENDALLLNGAANIFYVRAIDHELRAVRLGWNDVDGYWGVRADLIRKEALPWRVGDRVFSCGSLGA